MVHLARRWRAWAVATSRAANSVAESTSRQRGGTEMTWHDRPGGNAAEIHVLFEGYVNMNVTPLSVASTVTYVRDGEAQLIIDPGFVPSHRSILDPLDNLGVDPAAITD